MHENKDGMWLKPNADGGYILSIWQYTLSDDGYQYANENSEPEYGDLSNRKLEISERNGICQVTINNYAFCSCILM